MFVVTKGCSAQNLAWALKFQTKIGKDVCSGWMAGWKRMYISHPLESLIFPATNAF